LFAHLVLKNMAFKGTRWTVSNVIPVAFVLCVIWTIWSVHTFLHAMPLLRGERGGAEYHSGVWQACIVQSSTFLLLVCLVRAIVTDPGSVPDAPEWRMRSSSQGALTTALAGDGRLLDDPSPPPEDRVGMFEERGPVRECKKSGERRFCKWCDSYKPDRCHHCRICQSCILRMDHHCPWIANCIGYRNHKYFILLVAYALVSATTVFVTLGGSISLSLREECTQLFRFALAFARILAFFVMLLLGLFLPWHLWLMARATTTIEFCEKRFRGPSQGSAVSYDLGVFVNVRAVMGDCALLWLLPLAAPSGSGVYFECAGPLAVDARTSSERSSRQADSAADPPMPPGTPDPDTTAATGPIDSPQAH